MLHPQKTGEADLTMSCLQDRNTDHLLQQVPPIFFSGLEECRVLQIIQSHPLPIPLHILSFLFCVSPHPCVKSLVLLMGQLLNLILDQSRLLKCTAQQKCLLTSLPSMSLLLEIPAYGICAASST